MSLSLSSLRDSHSESTGPRRLEERVDRHVDIFATYEQHAALENGSTTPTMSSSLPTIVNLMAILCLMLVLRRRHVYPKALLALVLFPLYLIHSRLNNAATLLLDGVAHNVTATSVVDAPKRLHMTTNHVTV